MRKVYSIFLRLILLFLFLIDEKQTEGSRDVAAIKFIFSRFYPFTLCGFLFRSFIHSESDSETHQTGEEREEKRSANKGRWDHIHFSIRSFIQPHSLETKILRRMNGNFLRLARQPSLTSLSGTPARTDSVLLTQISFNDNFRFANSLVAS